MDWMMSMRNMYNNKEILNLMLFKANFVFEKKFSSSFCMAFCKALKDIY